MKKTLIIVVLIVFIISLCSCGIANDTNSNNYDDIATNLENTTEETTTYKRDYIIDLFSQNIYSIIQKYGKYYYVEGYEGPCFSVGYKDISFRLGTITNYTGAEKPEMILVNRGKNQQLNEQLSSKMFFDELKDVIPSIDIPEFVNDEYNGCTYATTTFDFDGYKYSYYWEADSEADDYGKSSYVEIEPLKKVSQEKSSKYLFATISKKQAKNSINIDEIGFSGCKIYDINKYIYIDNVRYYVFSIMGKDGSHILGDVFVSSEDDIIYIGCYGENDAAFLYKFSNGKERKVKDDDFDTPFCVDNIEVDGETIAAYRFYSKNFRKKLSF